jgi:hypothetical protein
MESITWRSTPHLMLRSYHSFTAHHPTRMVLHDPVQRFRILKLKLEVCSGPAESRAEIP